MFGNNKHPSGVGVPQVTPEEQDQFKKAVASLGKGDMQPGTEAVQLPVISIEDTGQADSAHGQDVVEYRSAGIQHNRLEKLRRGQIKYGSSLDLHGETRESARKLLEEFLAKTLGDTRTEAALIVHGKGKNSGNLILLKNRITVWLREVPEVLAYVSAKPADGGTGALYVLLKKKSIG